MSDDGEWFLAFFCVVCLLLFQAYIGFSDLINKNDIKEIYITNCYPVLEVKHYFKVIPMGTSDYYIGADEKTYKGYLIKGSKSWFNENFDSQYISRKKEGLVIKASTKKLDHKFHDIIEDKVFSDRKLSYPINYFTYLYIDYKFNAILKIINGFLALLLLFTYKRWNRHPKPLSTVLQICWYAGLVVALFIFLQVHLGVG